MTHNSRTLSGVFNNHILNFIEVLEIAFNALIHLKIVGIGVDSHFVSIASNVGELAQIGRELSGNEESGLHIFLFKDAQNVVGAHRRTVVEGKVDDFFILAHHSELFGDSGHIVRRVGHGIHHIVDAASVPIYSRRIDGESCQSAVVAIFNSLGKERRIVGFSFHNHHRSASGENGCNGIVGFGSEN